mmetsp:Transcript_35699/g.70671  ORF Transcript_35699/g.70671 Transcript_35699/m.70671 type:complete len:244 (+) Transcript_35699:973-1704(+)
MRRTGPPFLTAAVTFRCSVSLLLSADVKASTTILPSALSLWRHRSPGQRAPKRSQSVVPKISVAGFLGTLTQTACLFASSTKTTPSIPALLSSTPTTEDQSIVSSGNKGNTSWWGKEYVYGGSFANSPINCCCFHFGKVWNDSRVTGRQDCGTCEPKASKAAVKASSVSSGCTDPATFQDFLLLCKSSIGTGNCDPMTDEFLPAPLGPQALGGGLPPLPLPLPFPLPLVLLPPLLEARYLLLD